MKIKVYVLRISTEFFSVDEKEEENSECSNSLYAVFDPFDYMYSPSECSQHSDPIYAAVIKTQTPLNSPPPLPPRNYSTPANELFVSFYWEFHASWPSYCFIFNAFLHKERLLNGIPLQRNANYVGIFVSLDGFLYWNGVALVFQSIVMSRDLTSVSTWHELLS